MFAMFVKKDDDVIIIKLCFQVMSPSKSPTKLTLCQW